MTTDMCRATCDVCHTTSQPWRPPSVRRMDFPTRLRRTSNQVVTPNEHRDARSADETRPDDADILVHVELTTER
jgi:hypothetical protein